MRAQEAGTIAPLRSLLCATRPRCCYLLIGPSFDATLLNPTGSEVTPFAVVTDEKTGQKYPLADCEPAVLAASLQCLSGCLPACA